MAVTDSAERWLSVGEASRALGLSRTTLLAAEDAGLVTPIRTPGGHRRYDPAELDRYLGRSAVEAGAVPPPAALRPASPATDALHLAPAVRAAVRPLAQALDADAAGLYLLQDETLRFCAAFGVPRWLAERLTDSTAPPFIAQALNSRRHQIFDPAVVAFPETRTTGHGLAVALRHNDRAPGVLFLVARRDLLPGEMRVVDAFCELIASVVEDQLRISDLEHRLAQIAALTPGMKSVGHATDRTAVHELDVSGVF